MFKAIVSTVCISITTMGMAETHYIYASGMEFSPNVITVNAGDTIQWEYVSGLAHTVTTGTKCFWDGYFHASLASFHPIVIWDVPLDAPSEIPYFCLPHCQDEGMTAIIYVNHVCIADVTGDALVNVNDLLTVIDQWGTSNDMADVNDDGIVDVTDLLEVIGNWGPCA